MTKPRIQAATWLLLTVLAVVVYGAVRAHSLGDQVSTLLRYRYKLAMQTITEVVTRPNGDQVSLVTTRLDGESVADFIQRHDEAKAALEGS